MEALDQELEVLKFSKLLRYLAAPSPGTDQYEYFFIGLEGNNITIFSFFFFQIRLEDFPISVFQAAGIYYEADEHAIVCGGLPCDGLGCDAVTDCYQWTPLDGWELFIGGNLTRPRYGKHVLSQI